MKSKAVALTIIGLLLHVTQGAMAHWNVKKEHNCFPQTDREIPVSHGFVQTGLTEQEFNQALDDVAEAYDPVFESLGLTLKVVRLWGNSRINASAAPSAGNITERQIKMYGGLARHRLMTPDGFKMVACHEIGHHLAGAPLYSEPISIVTDFKTQERYDWYGSSEGQSDYFASLKCARKVFAGDDNISIVKNMKIPGIVKDRCSISFDSAEEAALCQRSAAAGLVISTILSELRKEKTAPDLNTPSSVIVDTTFEQHPKSQCRADTYFQGAVCHVDHRVSVSETDLDAGTCSRRLGDRLGIRPLCWFKPRSERRLLLASGY